MNVAFYCKNRNSSQVDCSNLKNGNPGIGGTYYAMLGVTYFLNHETRARHRYYLFAESVDNLPKDMDKVYVENEKDLLDSIEQYKIDILVINKTSDTLDGIIKEVESTGVKIVIWAHCFIPYFELGRYADYKNVARIVAVGKEQLMTFCDHRAFKKSTFIYNLCNYQLPLPQAFEKRKNNVVYIGSIVSLKGLHLLTNAWPKILDSVPDAQLYIIGSGKLYNQNEKLGKYGIAEYFYEKQLLKPILNEKRQIIPSVHFLGVMGKEKFDVLNEAKVAVPNPSGLTETFGYTAVEAELAGCLVATKKCPGYLDTVVGNENILYDNVSDLAEAVIKLLKTRHYDPSDARKRLLDKFSNESIITSWEILFDEIENGKLPFHNNIYSQLLSSRRKSINRKYQKIVPCLPSLMLWEQCYYSTRWFIAKLVDIRITVEKVYRRKIKKQ